MLLAFHLLTSWIFMTFVILTRRRSVLARLCRSSPQGRFLPELRNGLSVVFFLIVMLSDRTSTYCHIGRSYSTLERAVARRAARVSKDIATSVVGSGTRSGIATRARAKGKVSARTVGMAKFMARMDTQARRTAKEREAMARAACGRPALGVGLRSMSSRIARRTRTSSEWRRTSQRFSSSATFRTKKHWRDGRRCP